MHLISSITYMYSPILIFSLILLINIKNTEHIFKNKAKSCNVVGMISVVGKTVMLQEGKR